ncbi:hypothetical protein NQ318_006347 [Aromia moschata]|uniref:Uncharacterized protein n=1 Tax=Aromia moschata TaxID=1265417 RepID=A0AAV8X927_9CUCU|nr:hypothetical protein NQ318_006347 [Aromia moschata]
MRFNHHHRLEASPRQCFVVSSHLATNGISMIPQPPYSSDLPFPPDYFLFPKLKTALKGCCHGTLDAVKAATTRTLKDIPEVPLESGR